MTVTDDGCPFLSNTYTYHVYVDSSCCDDIHFGIVSCCTNQPTQGSSCDPCQNDWRTIWVEDDDGNPIGDPFDSTCCWQVSWSDGISTYYGFSIPAHNNIEYTVHIVNLCTGCSWDSTYLVGCCANTSPQQLRCLPGELEWSPVPNALTYQVELVLNDPNCCSNGLPPATLTYIVPADSFLVPIATACFSWRVRSQCSSGWGPWSESECYPCDSCMLAPPQDLCCNAGVLLWAATTNAICYEVDIIINNPACCGSGGIGVPMTHNVYPALVNTFPVVSVPGGCFSWRVRARCANGWGPWSKCICCSCISIIPPGGGNGNGFGNGIGTITQPISTESDTKESTNKPVLNDELASKELSVFPNPTSNLLHISGASVKTGSRIQIIDLSGRVIKRLNIKEEGEQSISTAELSDGMYLLQLIDSKGKALEVRKISVKH